MAEAFLHGVALYPELLDEILHVKIEVRPASIGDFDVLLAGQFDFGALVHAPGLVTKGGVADLSEADIARMDFFHACFGAFPHDLERDGRVMRVWVGADDARDLHWNAARWQADWAAITTATAFDIMALFGQRSPAEIRARLYLMMVRGASRLRAGGGATGLRRKAVSADVAVTHRRQPYAHFFAVEEYDLSFRKFGGGLSAMVNRAVFISGDAVTVVPYDPVRDSVLLIEQFRSGPYARGDDQPWLLEPIAGRIDPGEVPEQTARREALEEAGIGLGELLKVAEYYPSPGAKAEYLYSYVAIADLPDGTAGTHGLAEEAEDIRGHIVSFDTLMRLVETGEAANAPLILTALWLARERPRLRAAVI